MIATDIDVFLSCSFAAEDAAINDMVRAVCGGLRLACVNVAAGYSSLPPQKAKDFVERSAGLIGVITKRDQLANGDYVMPAAVREEVSIAFGLSKPILIVAEEGVRLDGFMNNYGTSLSFTREALLDSKFIQKLVFSLYTFRQELASNEDTLQQYATEFISESTRNLVSLSYEQSRYVWRNSLTKRLRFETALERDFTTSVWPAVPSLCPPDAPPARWSVSINFSSRPFEIATAVRVATSDRLEVSLRFEPAPQAGDVIEFTRNFESAYLNPLFPSDIPPGMPAAMVINGRTFQVCEGVVMAERTSKLHAVYEFPPEYGLKPEDVAVFVASHSFSIDYLAPWELKRVSVNKATFGRKMMIDVRVDDPLPRHLYGIAWTMPDAPTEGRKS